MWALHPSPAVAGRTGGRVRIPMAQIREWVPVYPATGSQVHRLGVPLRRRPGCTPVRSGIPGAPRLHASQQQSPLHDQPRGDVGETGRPGDDLRGSLGWESHRGEDGARACIGPRSRPLPGRFRSSCRGCEGPGSAAEAGPDERGRLRARAAAAVPGRGHPRPARRQHLGAERRLAHGGDRYRKLVA